MSDNLLQQYGIFLIGAGLSLALILLLFLLLRRNAMKSRGLRPAAAAVHATLSEDEAQDGPSLSANSAEPAPETADDGSSDAGSFKLFKRKKSHATDEGAKEGTAASVRLADIEQEMLAVRELFQTGQISRSVYVAETKALYETARLVKD